MRGFVKSCLVLITTLLTSVRHVATLTGSDTMLVYGRMVNKCKSGYGYPTFCPLPGEPHNRTKCCRHLDKPRCCDERARRVCMRPHGTRKAGTDIDPDPSAPAIFCPGLQDPDYYDICCWRKYSTFCCSRYITPTIFGSVFGGLALAAILSILGILYLKWKGGSLMVNSHEDMRSQRTASGLRRFPQT